MRRLRWLLAVVSALASAAWVMGELCRPYRGFSGNVVVEIKPGTHAPEVARLLASNRVLAHRWSFLLLHEFGRIRHHTLKAGEYLFDRPLGPVGVYRKLVRGDVYLHALLIPEGSDRLDIARILGQQLGLGPEDFLRASEQTALIRDLDPAAVSLEGYLYPDTYRFPRGVSPAAAIEAMVARFRQVLKAQLPPELAQSPRRLRETIILASLLEKETPDPAERPVIAGVFVRRLEKKMPLQSDPTVVYSERLAEGSRAAPESPITRAELAFPSPYNTYLHAGLPFGPICSPGLVSIRAALNPAAGSALYFVSNNRGGHAFASTLEEHERNVNRYRREITALRHAGVQIVDGPVPGAPGAAHAGKRAAAGSKRTRRAGASR
jgi:peptidoglycan lytic transglycosylase G